MAFAKLKAHLRTAAARTIDDLWKAIGNIYALYRPESTRPTGTMPTGSPR
jgi:hypothetical protein